MRKIFALTCHKLTNPLIHTVTYLSSFNENIVLIHLDKKSAIDEFIFLESNNVIFIPDRHDLVWGGYSQILATISLLRFATGVPDGFEYFFLISGDDIPLISVEKMNLFLCENYGLEFVHFQNGKNKIVDPYERVKYKYFSIHHGRKKNFLHKVLIKLHHILKFLFINKDFVKNLELYPPMYKGINWIGITNEMVSYVINYVNKNPWYLHSFKYSLCADEVFFHTIINTKPDAVFYFNSNAINNALRYIDWNSGPEYPKVLGQNDIENIKSESLAFFARKVSSDIDIKILKDILVEE
ncbi:core-2/I-branching enzyme [Erwinia sp. S43]|uniref:beta-1,6-N-acetylglucosaminyltransferase n=1 Tax=Erwinia sp. S43 TaxID=2769339 RepID=UPI00190A9871|nr:beta-1,6-N-acetylglucosaminyltransferase [Erwinia sp. S43]MBK0033755.1 core-2/I-branching enzyme [Erwinia sp. S43]